MHSPVRRVDLVIALIDDMGHADLTPAITPHLAAYEADGIVLSEHYVHPLCTPSRAALLTGRMCHRYHLCDWLRDGDGRSLSSAETLLPQLLRPLGYATLCVGKWYAQLRIVVLEPQHTRARAHIIETNQLSCKSLSGTWERRSRQLHGVLMSSSASSVAHTANGAVPTRTRVIACVHYTAGRGPHRRGANSVGDRFQGR